MSTTAPTEPAAGAPVPVLEGGAGGRAHRFWSVRRVPAALLALLVLGAAGLLLYDVAAVEAGRPGMRWRRVLADDLATRPLDDVAVLAGAAGALVLGLWLLVLACTPGLRAVLPMRRGDGPLRAGLRRDAVEAVLRERATAVAGVQSVRVRARRRKALVRAVSHFRELDDVRTDLDTALRAAVEELGLARPPDVSVHVRKPARKG
ncbi:hypothetical protein E2C00_14385 [Streptomyces sp. WAC05374]|uniref:DUF6286 domain-containing protein n=1 Tax=Streptomyces sp. WAC05374 TaxID=2487420 RepID=UPI000F8837AF|nr:DUF6286 domain-containing protein [Streptomyces sp. WAC05374]RST15502.1 hypothetical protein EF905_14800 [Streptomyces sp. WAC05374]TDF48267.1 hypothetical protein E2B92_05110 [Streptomyces sp. WAC05374]TDF49278.1 hypothetical protein E2C02_27395 [Streptomyces sp. WAC05374]TDF55200.1 hypothetical protein E2C00_14385 [Streptomyces sp. WAC05374]